MKRVILNAPRGTERSADFSFGFWVALAVCALPLGCGSSQAQQPVEQPTPNSTDSAEETTDTGADVEAVPAPMVTRADCSDGTCFPCGDGECPEGAYCDRDGPVGPACAWLTECAGKVSCGCIQRVLGASCQCESAGGPSVTCAH